MKVGQQQSLPFASLEYLRGMKASATPAILLSLWEAAGEALEETGASPYF